MKYYLSVKSDGVINDICSIMNGSREVREAETSYDIPYMWNLKRHDINKFIYKIEADLQI